MKAASAEISDVLILQPRMFRDDRGVFSETYNAAQFSKLGLDIAFIQDNRSLSTRIHTIRGLHFQSPPFAQTKLVSVQRGRILDVAVDLRRGSQTYRRHVKVELTAERGEQILVPVGFAHGFCTLEPDTIVSYKVDNPYAPGHEHGLHWRTAELGIDWPCSAEEGVLSPKDLLLPDRLDMVTCFP